MNGRNGVTVLNYWTPSNPTNDNPAPQVPNSGSDWAYHGSMYGFFETQFGVRCLNAEEKLRAVAADVSGARLLGVAPGTPLLAVDRITLTYGERPVEWRRGLCVTRDHHYFTRLG